MTKPGGSPRAWSSSAKNPMLEHHSCLATDKQQVSRRIHHRASGSRILAFYCLLKRRDDRPQASDLTFSQRR